jgi:hypothetical protein
VHVSLGMRCLRVGYFEHKTHIELRLMFPRIKSLHKSMHVKKGLALQKLALSKRLYVQGWLFVLQELIPCTDLKKGGWRGCWGTDMFQKN